jgi:hypothetical protein
MEIPDSRLAHPMDDAGDVAIPISQTMINAGIEAAKLISFEWGYDSEGTLVSRVYRAMVAASRNPQRLGHI